MPPVAVQLSYRLGGADGVAVEARKWEWALHELGFEVRRVAGELDDGLRPDDTWLPYLAIDPVDESTPAPDASRPPSPGPISSSSRTCAPPINPDASAMTAAVLAEHDGRVVFITTTSVANAGLPTPRTSLRTGTTRSTSRSTILRV